LQESATPQAREEICFVLAGINKTSSKVRNLLCSLQESTTPRANKDICSVLAGIDKTSVRNLL
jgi:hypothetical protein